MIHSEKESSNIKTFIKSCVVFIIVSCFTCYTLFEQGIGILSVDLFVFLWYNIICLSFFCYYLVFLFHLAEKHIRKYRTIGHESGIVMPRVLVITHDGCPI